MATLANKIQFDKVVERVNRILELAFEIKFNFTPRHLLVNSELVKKSTELEELSAPVHKSTKIQPLKPIYLEEDVLLPLAVNDNFVGVGQLIGAKKLSTSDVNRVGQIVDGLVCGSLALIEKINLLEERENHLRTKLPDSNVVPLDRYGHLRKNEGKNLSQKADVKKSGHNIPIFIHAKTTSLIHEIALELHTQTERLVLIDVNSLKMPLSVRSLQSFGDVTLFIKELAELNKDRMLIFEEFLKTRNLSSKGPAVITGSTRSGNDLIKRGVVSNKLFLSLAQIQIQHSSNKIDSRQLEIYVKSIEKSKKEFVWLSVMQSLGFTPVYPRH